MQPPEAVAPRTPARVPVLKQTYRRERGVLALFLAPSVIFLLLTSVYPLLNSLRLSFYSWNMMIPFSKPVWYGLGNYTRLLDDPEFWNAVKVTLIYVVAAVTHRADPGHGRWPCWRHRASTPWGRSARSCSSR